MQNEDDLRGLAKVMEFMRAISILFVVINIYWFCYQSIREWGINIGVVDRILLGFQHTAGLFSNILWTKFFAVVFLALSCLGTKGVKEQKITWRKIILSGVSGLLLFFFNWWLLALPLPLSANTVFYIAPSQQDISYCSWQDCGCPACSKPTCLKMCSISRTRALCRKLNSKRTSIPSISALAFVQGKDV